jgi:hypothetical protein
MLCHSYCLLCFLFNKIGERKGRTCSAWKWGELGGRGKKEGGQGFGRRGGLNDVYTYE